MTDVEDRRPVVVLVSASWAGPSRPAPTVLRELAGRWGDSLRTLLLEDAPDEALDALGIAVVPTWLLLRPVPAPLGQERTEEPDDLPAAPTGGPAPDHGDDATPHHGDDPACADRDHATPVPDATEIHLQLGDGRAAPALRGVDAGGQESWLRGSFVEVRRLTGARAKHTVETEMSRP